MGTESFDFGKTISGTFEILKGCGYEHAGAILDVENFSYRKDGAYWNYQGYDMWFVGAENVVKVVKELKGVSATKLKKLGIENEVADYYGDPIPEQAYDYYVDRVERMKGFLKRVSELNNYLRFAEA